MVFLGKKIKINSRLIGVFCHLESLLLGYVWGSSQRSKRSSQGFTGLPSVESGSGTDTPLWLTPIDGQMILENETSIKCLHHLFDLFLLFAFFLADSQRIGQILLLCCQT